ncbi:unnamed protein product [Ectocarpus sp. CCAP 1310/34]|nr:unnamed protein product [Ectocarpus sp. CCAP 1310/34]
MRGRRVSLGVVVLGWSPSVQAFVAPSIPEASSAKCVPLSTPAVKSGSDGSSSRSSMSNSGSAIGMSRRRAALAASTSVLKMSGEDEAAEEYGDPAAEVEVVAADKRKDAGVLAATGATGAIVGWSLGHSLGLDMMGMFAGGLPRKEGVRFSKSSTDIRRREEGLGGVQVATSRRDHQDVRKGLSRRKRTYLRTSEEILTFVDRASYAARTDTEKHRSASSCLAHPAPPPIRVFFAGCLAAVGLLAQEGTIGQTTAKVGEFALGAFEVVSTVATSTNVPAKVASSVGEEFLEVVEFTSGAVTKVGGRSLKPLFGSSSHIFTQHFFHANSGTPGGTEKKGYMDSLPDPVVRYKAQIARSKQTAAELKEQLDKVSAAFAEAKKQLKQRAENQRIVDAAKTTVAELAVSGGAP